MAVKKAQKAKFLVGVDEAGRGPLAGPVAVAAVCLPRISRFLGRVKDSKKLSERRREKLYRRVAEWQARGRLCFAVSLVGEKLIDRVGISRAIRFGVARCLRRLEFKPAQCCVLLDGSLRAPTFYTNQKTIIRGDETVSIIALASVIAKVKRDRRMKRLSKRYPAYGLERHKGYGTRAHYCAIKKHGPCPLHRRSFLGNLV